MFEKAHVSYLGVAFLLTLVCTLASNPARSQEAAEDPPETGVALVNES